MKMNEMNGKRRQSHHKTYSSFKNRIDQNVEVHPRGLRILICNYKVSIAKLSQSQSIDQFSFYNGNLNNNFIALKE